MFERPSSGERALLVHIDIGTPVGADTDALEELRLLAGSAGATVVGLATGSRAVPDPKLFVGSGKAEEIKALAVAGGAELVIFNHALSPSQERNLERLLECRVVDRNGLILDIFAQRARSFEGKLAGGAGATAPPLDPAGARLDPPGAPEGRHWPARAR